MHIPRIYVSQSLAENSTIGLEPEAAHHIAKVLRMKVGRQLTLFNGEALNGIAVDGCYGEFSATLVSVDKKKVSVELGSFIERQTESPLAIELGACLIKNDRMDWLLQKSVELGVSTIFPLFSEFTDVKIAEDRLEKKMQHWQRIIINACEQSGRVFIPTLHAPQNIQSWIASTNTEKKYVLHPYIAISSSDAVNSEAPISAALLVGPEGGLAEHEVECATNHNFTGLVLGKRILRAETAPIAALALLQHQFGDF
ncbi:MAG: 16S rRNA (uracil1498-N3)-methyltransferase [Kiritimatiellia bacterium]|jgi:16S rRNA (uracil1498-N3)-methyltransferase